MARKARYDLPKRVCEASIAILADYRRRATEIERGRLPQATLETYAELNHLCDLAAYDLQPVVRNAIMKDIELRRGWELSELNPIAEKKPYYNWKKKIVKRFAAYMKWI